MQRWILNNFWLKTVSLFLAIVTWLYISGELKKTPEKWKDYSGQTE